MVRERRIKDSNSSKIAWYNRHLTDNFSKTVVEPKLIEKTNGNSIVTQPTDDANSEDMDIVESLFKIDKNEMPNMRVEECCADTNK